LKAIASDDSASDVEYRLEYVDFSDGKTANHSFKVNNEYAVTVMGNYIYCVAEGGQEIYQLTLDDFYADDYSQTSVLKSSDCSIYCIASDGEYLYWSGYYEGDACIGIKDLYTGDGTHHTLDCDDSWSVSTINVYNGKVYYLLNDKRKTYKSELYCADKTLEKWENEECLYSSDNSGDAWFFGLSLDTDNNIIALTGYNSDKSVQVRLNMDGSGTTRYEN
jgi:hypothetical protein